VVAKIVRACNLNSARSPTFLHSSPSRSVQMHLASLLALAFAALVGTTAASTTSAISANSKQQVAQYKTIIAFYNFVLKPANTAAAMANNYYAMRQFFANDITYRYGDVSTFQGYVDISEFIIGATMNKTGSPFYFSGNYAIRQYVDQGYLVWLAIDIETKPTFSPAPFAAVNLTEYVALVFNDDGVLQSVDATVSSEGWALSVGLNFTDPLYPIENAIAICSTALNGTKPLCSQANTGYANYADCYNFITTLPVGLPGVGEMNNVVCRSNWLSVLPLRPYVHCPTIGKTGGTRCNNAFNYLHDFTPYPFAWGTFLGAPAGTGDSGDTASAASISLPAGSSLGNAAAETSTTSDTTLIAGVSVAVAALLGIAVGVALNMAVQHRRKMQDDASKPLVEGETSRVIIVENGLAREQDVKLLASTQIPC